MFNPKYKMLGININVERDMIILITMEEILAPYFKLHDERTNTIETTLYKFFMR